MEVLRFGPGHRRVGGPPGTRGVAGQIIFRNDRATVTELAFGPYAMITPHENQDNTALFIVISGGGFVQVGEDRARVSHGEAVVWPPGVLHGAYTDGTEMRAIIVELEADDGGVAVVEGTAAERAAHGSDPAPIEAKAEGKLAERVRTREEYDTSEGEPW